MDNVELQGKLYTICDEILKEIIEPVCGISGVVADYWLADIAVYTNDDEELNQKVYERLQDKYNISDAEIQGIDSFTTFIQMALFIYLDSARPKYPLIY